MKKSLFTSTLFLIGALTATASADNLLNIGGIRTKIYSFSTKSFDGAVRESRAMPNITGISNNGPLNIVYIESDKSEVFIEGDKELFCRVQTQYKEGVLNVSLDPGTYRNLWLQVVVYAPSLNSIKCTGSGNVKADKVSSPAGEMDIKVTGSAVVNIGQLNCANDLDMHISGSGDIRTDNVACRDLDVNITGSGNIFANKTVCKELECTVVSSGGAKFTEIESSEADLKVTGSGEIALKSGEVKVIKARVTGSGSITGDVKHTAIEQKTTGSGIINLK
ncbi:MAG: DUF2807 domain-containing protein [Bacteroidales bacterium]|nr:DUF2807 domain-containing protein [Bacteroidales bacterium]